ncbi:hypothetical protein HK098_001548 [Nowakowskiella sp. JEL0407]|nr:hypothetical protein HK098_001548 [Nowakowskiella sp. JEL0407]
MAEDLEMFLRQKGLERVTLMGHSMGGKVAMTTALFGSPKIEKLIVVDIPPANKGLGGLFRGYITAMEKIARTEINSPSEADEILKPTIPEIPIRQFLLTNLKKDETTSKFRWRVNLASISEYLDALGEFPPENLDKPVFDKPTLFVRGSRSDYIQAGDEELIKRYFPQAVIREIEAGHW